ncbi:MAG: hypothetical protein J6S67_07360 [Methanobrevibacter sp.]|nr:hypothetical protein [Methanobrevibacter sp.]
MRTLEEVAKDPRLDDEGTYDYLAEDLPEDGGAWSHTRYTEKCDSCGKQSHHYYMQYHYFYCWDGWDYMSFRTCWKCIAKSNFKGFVRHIKKNLSVKRRRK